MVNALLENDNHCSPLFKGLIYHSTKTENIVQVWVYGGVYPSLGG